MLFTFHFLQVVVYEFCSGKEILLHLDKNTLATHDVTNYTLRKLAQEHHSHPVLALALHTLTLC